MLTPKKKYPYWKAFVLAVSCVVFLGGAIGAYIYSLHRTLNEEMQTYLLEIAQQGVKIVQTQIDGDLDSLKSMATAISGYRTFDKDKMLPFLREESKNNNFKRMTFIFPNGVGMLSEGTFLDFSSQSSFQKAIAGKQNISDRFKDAMDHQEILVQVVPVFSEGEIRGALSATRGIDLYEEVLSVDSFGGEGYSIIIKSNGDKVVKSTHKNAVPFFNNIFDESGWFFWDTPQDPKKLRQDLASGRSGVVSFTSHTQGRMYIGYVPMGINDWYLLSIVPTKQLSSKMTHFVLLSGLFSLYILAIFAVLVFLIFNYYRKNQEKLYKLAYTDPVTGQPNWAKQQEEMKRLLEENPSQHYALIALDVNKFKIINDLYGHKTGDVVLTHILGVLRENLGDGEECSRINADLFQTLMKFNNDGELKNRLQLINEKIVNFKAPDGLIYQIVLSFGVYVIEKRTLPPHAMLDRALFAQQMVKGNILNTVAFYSDNIRRQSNQEKRLENDMEKALARGEFEVLLQPAYGISSGDIVGAEVSVRWNHPTEGVLPESVFRSIFEKNGFISRLEMFMLEEACKLLASGLDKKLLGLCVNISRIHIYNLYFPKALASLAKKHRIKPSTLAISLSGGTGRMGTAETLTMMNRLREEGFKVFVNFSDDGSSSLALLKNFTAQLLRLDTHLLSGGGDMDRSEKMLAGLVSMAKQLGMQTLAEGVDTPQEAETAKRVGCDFVSGCAFSAPLNTAEFKEKIK